MKLTDMLRIEHDLIVQAIDALRGFAETIETGPPPLDDLTALLDFFVTFTDGVHHEKEERLLFPTLERHGLPSQGGPLGCMLSEHEEGRRLVADMRRLVEDGLADADARARFRASAREFGQLLFQHIMKENQVLFAMAERIIAPELLEEMGAQHLDAHREAMGAHRPRVAAWVEAPATAEDGDDPGRAMRHGS
jgi:hemerythrin-like domain-containing protein